MTTAEPSFDQLRSEFPGLCVVPSATGRVRPYSTRVCGLKEKKPGTGTCMYHRDPHMPMESKALGRCLSRAERELALVFAQFRVDSMQREELAVELVAAGWRRDGPV